MPSPGNDPFSGSSVQNVLQHTISPKIVTDGSGGYTVKTDLVNIDNIYLTGSIIGGGGGGQSSGITYIQYTGDTLVRYRTATTTPPFTLTGTSGYVAITNYTTPTITSGKTYFMSANLYYLASSPAAGDKISFLLANGPSYSTPTNISTPTLYPFTDNYNFITLSGIFVSNGQIPQILFSWSCATDISNRLFDISVCNFGCIQLN